MWMVTLESLVILAALSDAVTKGPRPAPTTKMTNLTCFAFSSSTGLGVQLPVYGGSVAGWTMAKLFVSV